MIDKKDIAALRYVIDGVQTIRGVVVRLDRDFLFAQWIHRSTTLIIVIMTSSSLGIVTRITLGISINVPTSLFVAVVPQSKSEMQSRVERIMENFLSNDSMQIGW